MKENSTLSAVDQKKIISFMLIVMFVVSAFGLGVYVGGGGTGNTGIISGSSLSYYNPLYIENVLNEIEENYLGDIPSSQSLTYGMVKGLVEELDDDYSSFLSPEEAEMYLQDNDSSFEGIGVYLAFKDEYTVIQSVIKGSPGAKEGLKAEDIILEVNGEDMYGVRPETAASKILGEAGTEVTIKVFREKKGKAFEFTITREKINLENIQYENLGEGVFLIDIVKFTEGDNEDSSGVQVFNNQWDKLAADVSRQNPKGLIIDLRNNPGGFVHSVRYVLQEFLEDGQVLMQEQEKGVPPSIFKDARKGVFENIPLVVLVNEGSASASEIFAGAIQDNKRGKVIGEETVGKGVEQVLITLEDDSILMLVFRRWLTAAGVQLDKENPIVPDEIVVYEPPKQEGDYDSQVTKAIEILEKLIPS